MKRAALPWFLVSILALLFCSPAKAAVQRSQIATIAVSATQNSGPGSWKRYRYEADGFSIEFPAEPKAQPNDSNTGTRYSTSQENDTLAYFAEKAELPASINKTPEQFFDGYVGGAASGTKSKVNSQKTLSLRGYPGREFVLESDTLILKFRLYLVGKALYQVLVVTTKNLPPRTDTDRFLDSFEFIK